jgi:pimeloyl-ACP methyl ester carboxylesterase
MPFLETDAAGATRLAYDFWPGHQGAPVVVYCHGLLSSRRGDRASALRAFCAERGWALLCFDFQGRGESSGSLRELTLSRQVGDLGSILAVLPRGARPLLFGSSYGGLTAAWFAALYPERVAACALLAPALRFVPDLLVRIGLAEARRWRERGWRHFEPPADVDVHYGLVADSGFYPDAVLAASLTVPTMVWHGTADDSVPCAHSVALAQRAACVDLHLVRGGDHVLGREMPEVLAALPAFLARVSERAGGGR